MIWTDKTHVFAATHCRHLGRPCPAAERLLTRLAASMAAAEPVTQEDFEVAGESRLEGCGRPCTAQFAASHSRVRLYCGVSAGADRAALDRFADALLSPDGTALPSARAGERPCALAEALPHKTGTRPAAEHAAL
ncbi:hypothetical protein ACUXV3_10710 [Roseobacteraceae bacterium NS-SX3]